LKKTPCVSKGSKSLMRGVFADGPLARRCSTRSAFVDRYRRLVCAFPADLRFRKGKSMIIPYTSLDISAGENLCIRHARVGPCPHMALSTQSAQSMLAHNNITVLVDPSAIPFRDW
jgi:hypothetical protein